MEPFDSIIDEVATSIGAKPGSYRWEVITACFGWTACVSLTLGLGLAIFGYKSFSSYAISAFSFFVWIALKRDWKKIRARDTKKE
jgi:hypothetical protein